MKIAIIGDRNPEAKSQAATDLALSHSANFLNVQIDVDWLPTSSVTIDDLLNYDGLWIAPGGLYKNREATLNAIRYARENNVPLIGTCGGFQHVVLEHARQVLEIPNAEHAEYEPNAQTLVVEPLSCSLVGKRAVVSIAPDCRTFDLYQTHKTEENFNCTFGLNHAYYESFNASGLRIVGTDEAGEARIVELSSHPFFIATLFLPQTSSTPENPHPLLNGFISAALQRQKPFHA